MKKFLLPLLVLCSIGLVSCGSKDVGKSGAAEIAKKIDASALNEKYSGGVMTSEKGCTEVTGIFLASITKGTEKDTTSISDLAPYTLTPTSLDSFTSLSGAEYTYTAKGTALTISLSYSTKEAIGGLEVTGTGVQVVEFNSDGLLVNNKTDISLNLKDSGSLKQIVYYSYVWTEK